MKMRKTAMAVMMVLGRLRAILRPMRASLVSSSQRFRVLLIFAM